MEEPYFDEDDLINDYIQEEQEPPDEMYPEMMMMEVPDDYDEMPSISPINPTAAQTTPRPPAAPPIVTPIIRDVNFYKPG